MTKTFEMMPDTLEPVVASAGSPSYFEPTMDVGGAPLHVPAKRLQVALAEKTYPLARSAAFYSHAKWDVVAEFLDGQTDGITFEANGRRSSSLIAGNADALVVVELEYRAEWTVTIAAKDRPTANKWMDALGALLPEPPPPPPPEPLPYNVIPVRFWMQNPGTGSAYSRRRNITVTDWSDIEANYAASVRADLAKLATMDTAAGGKLILLHGPPGSGKAQPHDAKILTPNGWTTMGEIQPEDMVCSPNGGWARVKAKYPQGEVPIYRVTFSDGTSTRACGDHLWAYKTKQDRTDKKDRWRVASTVEMQDRLFNRGGDRNAWIPMVTSVDFAEQAPLPIDPYVLGVLIGDGYLREKDTSYSKPDAWLSERMTDVLGAENVVPVKIGTDRPNRCATWRIRGLQSDLTAMGLVGCGSLEKFIPPQYLTATEKDRWELLAGLLDTDGYAKGATCEYSTSSPQLARDVKFLLWSLGCTFAEAVKIPTYSYKGEKLEGAPSHRFHICPPKGVNPFRMPRKADAFRPRSKYEPRRAMVSIEYEGMEEASCIAVDSDDSLYVTDDFIVTHNTRLLLSLMSQWRDWCSASVVTDTDRFFNDPTYCNSLIFESDGSRDWMMLVLEDADEFIAISSKANKGQAISRLLNLADGIVGQGLNLLTIMTTNVAVDELNPAVIRPGRCLANIQVGPLPVVEANAWLADKGSGATVEEDSTLASLYATLNAT